MGTTYLKSTIGKQGSPYKDGTIPKKITLNKNESKKFEIGDSVYILSEEEFDSLQKQDDDTNQPDNEPLLAELNAQISKKEDIIKQLESELQQYKDDTAKIINENQTELQKYKEDNSNLQETIEKQKFDIHEQAVLLNDFISPKQHSDELSQLKDDLANKKAELLIACNNNINHYKNEYNVLATRYNSLIEDVSSLTRINTFFNGRHKEITEKNEPVELLLIEKDNTQNTTLEIVEGIKN